MESIMVLHVAIESIFRWCDRLFRQLFAQRLTPRKILDAPEMLAVAFERPVAQNAVAGREFDLGVGFIAGRFADHPAPDRRISRKARHRGIGELAVFPGRRRLARAALEFGALQALRKMAP